VPYIDPEDGDTFYRTLEDLILDLIEKPDQLFLRDSGCEALVYVEEIDQILLIECQDHKDASAEVRREVLQDKLAHIRRALR
jgi:acetyl-CoA carboxylase beta subunit